MAPHARRQLHTPADHQFGVLLGRDFITAAAIFHETALEEHRNEKSR